jgi:hypothetical protein
MSWKEASGTNPPFGVPMIRQFFRKYPIWLR